MTMEFVQQIHVSGRFMGWLANGHHDPRIFADHINNRFNLTPEDKLYCRPEHVRQIYYRTILICGGEYREFRKTNVPDALKVTIAPMDQLAFERDYRRKLELSESLNWAKRFAQENDRAPNLDESLAWVKSRESKWASAVDASFVRLARTKHIDYHATGDIQ